MTQLTLRLQADDVRAFDQAAQIIAGGPLGAPFVGRTTIIRRALKVFNDQASARATSAEAGK